MFVLITVLCVQIGPGEICKTEIAPAFFHTESICREASGRVALSTIRHIAKTDLRPTRLDSFCHEMEARSG